jgi:Spy/CpxP family protein refolding chaperone
MKTTAKNTFLLLAFLCFSSLSYAQPKGAPAKTRADRQQEKRENIESMKIAFLTNKLDLTPDEAQKFWPVYNQYQDKLHELRKQRRMNEKDSKKNLDELSDKEIAQAIENDLANRQKELDLQKEYNSKFQAVLPIRKVSRLYAAEEQFKMVLLEKLKGKPLGGD